MLGSAIKDAKGLPPNIEPPRSRWLHEATACALGHRCHVAIYRQRYRDIKSAYSGGAFLHKWWSWQVQICWFGTRHIIYRWRERWAV
jgi:hypothetical protein